MPRSVASRSRNSQLATALTPADPKPQLGWKAGSTDSNPRFLQLVPYVTGPLKAGTRLGTTVFDIITIVNGASTGYAHPLGRIPNGFQVWFYTANIQMWLTPTDLAALTATSAQWHGNGAGSAYGVWL